MRTNKKNKLVHCKIKCFDRSMEVKLPAFLEDYDRPTDRPTDRPGHREVSLPITLTITLLQAFG